jgi:hypothetical protein
MSKHPDAKIIEDLGGPAQVAERLNLPKYGGVQRVQNWTVRGIPSAVKVQHPALFMPNLLAELVNNAQAATETVANDAAQSTSGVVHA